MHSTSAQTISPTHKGRRRLGFTLVEVMAISPVIILVVMVIVAFMVALTGDALMSRERSVMVYDVQSGLDQIETDVRLATQILPSTGPLPSPQGSDDVSGQPFTSNASVLALEQYSSSRHPSDPGRSLLYFAGTPSPCGPLQTHNKALTHKVIYFIRDTTLMRRTVVEFAHNSVCSSDSIGSTISVDSPDIWQKNSCATESPTGRCFTVDTVVARNISSVSHLYYDSAQLTGSRSTPSSNSVAVRTTLTGSRQVAGSDVTYTASVTATNIQP